MPVCLDSVIRLDTGEVLWEDATACLNREDPGEHLLGIMDPTSAALLLPVPKALVHTAVEASKNTSQQHQAGRRRSLKGTSNAGARQHASGGSASSGSPYRGRQLHEFEADHRWAMVQIYCQA